MNDGYGYTLDQIRGARREPGVLCSAFVLASEQIPRDTGVSQIHIPDSKTVEFDSGDHWVLASREATEPQFLDALRLGE